MKENMIAQVIQVAFVEVKNIGFNNVGVEETSLFAMSRSTLALRIFCKLG